MRVIVRKERPHPGAQLRFTDIDGHRFTAFATDAPARAARRPGAAPPPPGPLRGPDPRRQGHRAAQPAPARLRPEPDLVRARRAGLRTPRLDADARPRRPRPRAGNPNGCGCGCSPPPAGWSAAAAGCGCTSPRPGPGPASSPPRSPACRPSPPADQPEPAPATRKGHPRARGTPPTRRDSRADQPHPAAENSRQPTALRPPSQDHVRVGGWRGGVVLAVGPAATCSAGFPSGRFTS